MMLPWDINFDPVKYVKETLSRVGYACEKNFDPLAHKHPVIKMKLDSISYQ